MAPAMTEPSDSPHRFPFGDLSTPRSPRRPQGECKAFVIGVYPSAIHVRWDLPSLASAKYGRSVAALAVADEPTVFWDGAGEAALVAAWKQRVGFREGDAAGEWGHVRGVGNGTSGRPVIDNVLKALGIDAADTWFTDAINEFFVKRAGALHRQQGDVLDAVYAPFAAEFGLPTANLPARPTPAALVALSKVDHRDRLRGEFVEAESPVVITLGEEARRVLVGIADSATGVPLAPLAQATMHESSYGEAGRVVIGDTSALWYALAHPGNRDSYWRGLHAAWQQRRIVGP